jgi:hypothetical protein
MESCIGNEKLQKVFIFAACMTCRGVHASPSIIKMAISYLVKPPLVFIKGQVTMHHIQSTPSVIEPALIFERDINFNLVGRIF